MSETAKINDLEPKLNLTKLPLNQVREHRLNKDCPWVRQLLIELNENATTKDPEDYLQNTFLNIDLKIQKKFEPNLGEYLLMEFKIESTFITECVKTLDEMNDHLEIENKCCFIEQHFADEPEYADQTDIYMGSDMYELYFYENRQVELKEMLHEQIYLNVNQYPSTEAKSAGEAGSDKETLH